MKPINSTLNQHLLATARQLDKLTALLRSDLPAECDGHFHVASIREDTISIVTDSPVWTTRLRQLGPRLLEILQSRGNTPCQHVRIISGHGPLVNKPSPTSTKRQLSASASEHIEQTSAYVQDADLSHALRRLARHKTEKN